MSIMLKDAEIGGGIVRRRFSLGGRDLALGTRLTGEELRAIPATNRHALVKNRFVEIWPGETAAPAERFVVNRGFGRYDVVEGRKLNREPLAKEDAEILGARTSDRRPS